MEHEQKRHEKHEEERKQKQAEERQSEQRFSLPGPTIRPLWFLALGFVLVLSALAVWMFAYR
jgi:cytoskeletal protein RodZ